MNDLDRDLKTLFDEKARGVQASPAAPARVLKKARRRQFGSVFIVGALLIGIAGAGLAGVASLRGAPTRVPANPDGSNGSRERTVSIQGIGVTAPEGWTLVDLWPVAAYLAGDVTECSFTATGTPVGQVDESEPVEQPKQECTTHPAPLPAGLPVLQLSNSDLGVAPICSIGEGDPPDLAPGATALYVSAFPAGRSTDSLVGVCPRGATISTFGQGEVTYATVVALGPEAAAEDATSVEDLASRLSGQGLPTIEAPVANGPGYVVAAGSNGGFTWRLEAGFNPPADVEALGIGGVLIVTDDHGSESMSSVPLPTEVPAIAQTDELGDGFITWGAADPTVTAIQVVSRDGSAAPAALVGWPESMQTFLKDASPLGGSLWWAITPSPGNTVGVTLADGTVTSIDVAQALPGDA